MKHIMLDERCGWTAIPMFPWIAWFCEVDAPEAGGRGTVAVHAPFP
jgi:hypothetical protein